MHEIVVVNSAAGAVDRETYVSPWKKSVRGVSRDKMVAESPEAVLPEAGPPGAGTSLVKVEVGSQWLAFE